MWQHVVVAAAVSYPRMYSNCFPASASELIMGFSGVYDDSIVAADGSVTCTRGVLAENVAIGDRISGCNSFYQNDGGTSVSFKSVKTYKIVCAEYGREWRYAAAVDNRTYDVFSSSNRADDDDAVSATSVLIVGSGAGAWAAAAAIRAANAHIDITVVGPGESTTARSSGTVWFPDRVAHTTARLKQTTGGSEIDSEWLATYIREGARSREYWGPKLGLIQYAAFGSNAAGDYTLYDGTERVSASFVCKDGAGGGILLAKLKALAAPVRTIVGTVDSISNTSAAIGNTTVIFRSVVFGTGGNGNSQAKYANATLAVSSNTGIHVRTAEAHGILLTPQFYYHLEYDSSDAGATWRPRWFAFDGCRAANVSNYRECADYSTRAQDHLDGPAVAMANMSVCGPNTTGAYWNSLYSGWPECTADCGACVVRSGIIDGKISFANMSNSYKAITSIGGGLDYFLSGTAASAATRDAYFGPGATLGFALHTGRMIATDPLFAVLPTTMVSTTVPSLFIAGAWTVLGGIVAHAAGFARVHYVLQPTGTTLITTAVLLSKGTMKVVNPTHYYIGYATLALLWTIVAAGLYASTHPAAGNAHAAGGIVASGLIAYLYGSAFVRPSALFLYAPDWRPEASYVWTAVLATASVLIVASRASAHQNIKYAALKLSSRGP